VCLFAPATQDIDMTDLPDFDDSFAGPIDHAKYYRALGWQVVPAYHPKQQKNFKRPALNEWREYTKELVDDGTFEKWFGDNGQYSKVKNLGVITGVGSPCLFSVDLDFYSHSDAAIWWASCEDMQEHAGELDTVVQTTGGGGKQRLYLAPEGWRPPTNKTSIGVDIRGVGGFAMLPPSEHSSGNGYSWDEGCEPWTIEVAVAPIWLCNFIDETVARYGGGSGHVNQFGLRTPTPLHQETPYGELLDGREDYMMRLVWARMVDLYREGPMGLDRNTEIIQRDELFSTYLRKTHPRLSNPNLSKEELLEQEGRGRSAFNIKWEKAKRQWDGKVSEYAKTPKPVNSYPAPVSDFTAASRIDEIIKVADLDINNSHVQKDADIFECLSVLDIYNLPDPKFLIDGLVIESGLGFVYGVPGCLKSFITIGMGLSIASKLPEWWGRKIHKSGPVIYISSEGVSDMKFRIRAWAEKKGIDASDIPFILIQQSMNFMDVNCVSKLIKTIRVQSERLGATPAAIFVDTVSRVLPGADENLQKDMTLFINACDALKQTFGVATIGVHHMNRNGGTTLRGSTVFDGAADFLLHVERENGAMAGTITARKIKAAIDGWQDEFSVSLVELNTIDHHTSLFVEKLNLEAPQAQETPSKDQGFGGKQQTKAEPDMDQCRRMVASIGEAWDGGYPWSSNKNSRKTERYAADKLSAKFGVSVDQAEKLIRQWLWNDVIVVEGYRVNTKTTSTGLKVAKGL